MCPRRATALLGLTWANGNCHLLIVKYIIHSSLQTPCFSHAFPRVPVPWEMFATEVGILVFLLRQPIPPFHPYFGGLKVITDEGASEKWWAHKDLHVYRGGGWRRKAVMVGLIHSSWSWCLRERKGSEGLKQWSLRGYLTWCTKKTPPSLPAACHPGCFLSCLSSSNQVPLSNLDLLLIDVRNLRNSPGQMGWRKWSTAFGPWRLKKGRPFGNFKQPWLETRKFWQLSQEWTPQKTRHWYSPGFVGIQNSKLAWSPCYPMIQMIHPYTAEN